MSAFAIVALHDARLPCGASAVDATIRLSAAKVDDPGGVDLALRVWTPVGATVAILRELAPGCGDLTPGARASERLVDHPAGRWHGETRDYTLAVALAPGIAGDELLAARLAVVVAGEVVARTQIVVTWSDDEPTGSATEQPTGASPEPRHMRDAAPEDAPCPSCRAPVCEGDRFCEACGAVLTAGQAP